MLRVLPARDTGEQRGGHAGGARSRDLGLELSGDHHEPGARGPRCGWMAPAGASTCPVEGAELEPRDDIVEDGLHAAIEQDAEVLVLHDRPDLGPLGGIAATLRF